MRRSPASSPCAERRASPRRSDQVRLTSTRRCSRASSSARSSICTRRPFGTRTTNCSRESADSLTRALNSTDSPAEGVLEDVGHPHPDAGVVAVAGDVDEAGDEAAEVVLADEQLGAAALLQLGHRHGGVVQLLDARLDELVARVALEHLEEVLAGVAVERDAGAVEDGLHLLGDERHALDRLGVGGGRVEPEEAALPDDLTALVVLLDPDVVEVRDAVHRGAGVGLGEHEDLRLVGLLGRLRCSGRQAPGPVAGRSAAGPGPSR